MVPAGKIIAFFSDAYHCEWCWPKLRLVKQIMGEILVDRVAKGWYDLDTALSIIPPCSMTHPSHLWSLRMHRRPAQKAAPKCAEATESVRLIARRHAEVEPSRVVCL